MFKLFQRTPPVYAKALLTDEDIKHRASEMAKKMGKKLATAKDSEFKFVPGRSAVLYRKAQGELL